MEKSKLFSAAYRPLKCGPNLHSLPQFPFYTACFNPTGLVTLLQRCPKLFARLRLALPPMSLLTATRLRSRFLSCPPLPHQTSSALNRVHSALSAFHLVRIFGFAFLYPLCLIHFLAPQGHSVFLSLLRTCHWKEKKKKVSSSGLEIVSP